MKYFRSVPFLLALMVSSNAFAQADQSFVADLVYQVQQLQEEVRQLRGQMDQQSHELKNLKARQRDQYLDLDSRLGELQKAPVIPAVKTNTTPPPVITATPIASNTGQAPDTDNQAANTTLASTDTTQTDPVEPAPAIDDKTAYQAAFTNLRELRYTEAAEGFYAFMENYPDSPLAGNAQYWLGESYYVTRNYDFALESFQALLANYPESKKVPDAWLKIGYTYYEMKDYPKALDILNRVKQDYPDTTLAKLADSRLQTMQMEGIQ